MPPTMPVQRCPHCLPLADPPSETLSGFFGKLFSTSDFPPRWYCGTWSEPLGWLHIVSDVGIFAAYLAIPCLIGYFACRRKDVPFPRVSWLFAAFILLCGTGHLLEAAIFWWPAYRVAGLWKLLTALVSCTTAVYLYRVLPQLLELPSLARVNNQLRSEIEQRKAAEGALDQAQMFKQAILDAASETAIIACDVTGTITVFNRGAEQMLGYPAAEMIGLRTPQCFHLEAEVVQRSQELSRELGMDVQGFDVFVEIPRRQGLEQREWTYITREGRHLTVRLTVTCVRNPQNEVIGFLGVALDITAEKARTAELRRLAHIASKTHNAVVSTDREGRIEWVNEGFTRLTGYTLEEVRGQIPGHVLQGPDTNPATRLAMRNAIRTGQVWDGEIYNYDKQGRGYWQSLSITPVTDESGELTGFISMQMDITPLREALSQCDLASRTKSEFLANMSHEIRTPLTAILGFAEILKEEIVDPDSAELAATIHRNGEHLLQIVNDILDLTKIESGVLKLHQDDVNLAEFISSLALSLGPKAEAKGLSLATRLEADVPATIATDSLRLRQVLMNLVSNAVKFTEQGGVTIGVRSVELSTGPHVAIDVVDTGIGISKSEQSRLFQPFQQVDGSLTREHGGTGLGLHISRQLTELLGGRIELDSQEGAGSRFTILLPTVVAAELQVCPLTPVSIAPTLDISGRLAGCQVLLVEDGVDNRKLAEYILQKAGAQVTHAVDGLDALAQLLESQESGKTFDVVLMDLQMPEMDGLTTTLQFRLRGFTRPIIAVTAQDMTDDRERCLAAGCDAVVTKPFAAAALLDAIEQQWAAVTV